MDVLFVLMASGAIVCVGAFAFSLPGWPGNRNRELTRGMGFLHGCVILGFIAIVLPLPGRDHLIPSVAVPVIALSMVAVLLLMVARIALFWRQISAGLGGLRGLARAVVALCKRDRAARSAESSGSTSAPSAAD